MNKRKISLLVLFILALGAGTYVLNFYPDSKKELKIYWFIPDGLRAEDEVFKIYEWAEKGELPNIKFLMDNGSRGYSRPIFPSHTPVNFATLLTGSYPDVNGVADGAMREQGLPLQHVAYSGYSSTSKKIPSIWRDFEKMGLFSSLLSVPGSTPPDLNVGLTINGRWGGWGVNFPAIIFNSNDKNLTKEVGINKRLFTFGSDLTRFQNARRAEGWKIKNIHSFSAPYEVDLSNWGLSLFALVIDSSDDQIKNYDAVLLSHNKKDLLAQVSLGKWSEWLPATLSWNTKDSNRDHLEKENIKVASNVKIKIIKLGDSNSYRIRIVYDNANPFNVEPSSYGEEIKKKLGPMVDFVDNNPPQLIYFNEDKDTFLEESEMSWDWHQKAVSFLIRYVKSNAVIHSIYNPNQMLTSRWWLPYLDPQSPLYNKVSTNEREKLWTEVKQMYKHIDQMVGEILKNKDKNTYIVLSSDHGAVPLYKEVRLNNFFASKGWLKFFYNKKTESYEIDWRNTKVVYLQMNNVYINPQGLSGDYRQSSGPAYEKLRDEVAKELNKLIDAERNNAKLLAKVWTREEATAELHLPANRIGDLIISNSPFYNWTEDLSADLQILKTTLRGGYKQAISNNNKALLTPFIIMGPNVKKSYLLKETIDHVDQHKTILHLLDPNYSTPSQGKILKEILVQ